MKRNISYKNTGYFSSLITDYLEQKESVKAFYTNYSNIEGFKNQIQLKQNFSIAKRKVLVKVLKHQYKNSDASSKTKTNIELLKQTTTFTVTTGHQLNLFTGPLYFLYKILTTITLAKQLKTEFPTYNFVPVYWMATEDHDFEEINFFNFEQKKITWQSKQTGAVGRFSTEGLNHILQELKTIFRTSKKTKELLDLFEKSYLKHSNLAEATRYLTNALFSDFGLIVLDADSAELKREFSSIIKQELVQQTAFTQISTTSKSLKTLNYVVQVNPRKINLFYMKDNLRERIVLDKGIYKVTNTKLSFSREEILEELKNNPQHFSPNVVMRPLYQENILPNLAYIGGGGELAYWFQLKNYFTKVDEVFPVLVLRNSVVLLSSKQLKKLDKLQITVEDLFLPLTKLINKKIKEISDIPIDFSPQKKHLQQQFKNLKEVAKKTDSTFLNAVNAQETKQLRGLEKLEKRLLKAQKRKLKEKVEQITTLHHSIFPNGKLQERTCNFSEFYILNSGVDLLSVLAKNLHPLDCNFTVLNLNA